MNNIANGEDDEKDKKIKELEETLKKQKELMEILQRKLCDTPTNEVKLFVSSSNFSLFLYSIKK